MILTSSANLPQFAMRIVMIDNYDSFTFNLVQYFQMLGMEVTTIRNNESSVAEVLALKPNFFVISPGPSNPSNAGICLELIQRCAADKIPLLGVCLGHQAIGQALGGKVVRATIPVHGKVFTVKHTNQGVFAGLKNPLPVTRYHSLVIDAQSCPKDLEVTATTNDGLIMGVKHKTLSIEGVQFHPESVLTEFGLDLLANFAKSVASR